jgi:hypothetical protein
VPLPVECEWEAIASQVSNARHCCLSLRERNMDRAFLSRSERRQWRPRPFVFRALLT